MKSFSQNLKNKCLAKQILKFSFIFFIIITFFPYKGFADNISDAIMEDDLLSLKKLINEQNVNRIEQNMTPLSLAAFWGRTEIAKFLLSKGADINYTNANGETPIDIARHLKNNAFVELLEKEITNRQETTSEYYIPEQDAYIHFPNNFTVASRKNIPRDFITTTHLSEKEIRNTFNSQNILLFWGTSKDLENEVLIGTISDENTKKVQNYKAISETLKSSILDSSKKNLEKSYNTTMQNISWVITEQADWIRGIIPNMTVSGEKCSVVVYSTIREQQVIEVVVRNYNNNIDSALRIAEQIIFKIKYNRKLTTDKLDELKSKIALDSDKNFFQKNWSKIIGKSLCVVFFLFVIFLFRIFFKKFFSKKDSYIEHSAMRSDDNYVKDQTNQNDISENLNDNQIENTSNNDNSQLLSEKHRLEQDVAELKKKIEELENKIKNQ